MSRIRTAVLVFAALWCAAAFLAGSARGADWKPEKYVEIIAGTAPGSGVDLTARLMQTILQSRKLVDVPVNVVNKPGGGYNVAFAYLNQFTGDAHKLFIATPTILTAHITGTSAVNYADYTALANLVSEPVIFIVRPDSPIRSARDFVERIKADPSSVSLALAAARGNAFHLAAALVARTVGADVRKLRIVVFNASGEGMTAMLGGHVDMLLATAANVAPLLQAGKIRIVAVAARERLPGAFAAAPTWKEHGINVTIDQWRGLLGPKGLTSEQVRFWDGTIRRFTETEEWRKDLEKNVWIDAYMDSEATRRDWRAQYDLLKALLADLGMAK